MSSLRVRISEGETKQPNLIWDSVWIPSHGMADWALADADEEQNRGGLRSKAALHTAVAICLFTDKRVADDHPLRYLLGDSDPRGWFGDGVDVRADLNETQMGSLLWIFERSPLTHEIGKMVEAVALEALAPLLAQFAAARIDVQANTKPEFNRCDLFVQIYGRDGSRLYNYQFDDIWQQTASAPKPEPFVFQPEQ